MKILAHRGWHQKRVEENSTDAFMRALKAGFGIETDIRDAAGKIVIAHDVPARNAQPLEALLKLHKKLAPSAPLALNIKADGLQAMLLPLLKRYKIRTYFLFDMSGPEAVRYLKAGACCFTRQSEYEPLPAFYDKAVGVWLDAFKSDWVNEATVRLHARAKKQICFVSPELHGRPYKACWKFFKAMERAYPKATFLLCTDHPEEAAAYFHD